MKKRLRARAFLPFYVLILTGFLAIAAFGSKVATVMSQSTPLVGRRCIVIDPGHGGVDGGATSCSGILESVLNLEIALRLNDVFRLLGYETVMIRTTDISVYTEGETIAAKKISDLKNRVRIINETHNALLVSIHQNQFSDSRYSGAQVFYANTAGSMELAEKMQTAFVASVNPGSNRRAKKSSGVYLMEHISCTGVLVECGFLSHVEEETKLRSAAYQKQLCCVIAATVSSFIS